MNKNNRVVVGVRIKPPASADAPCPHADKVFSDHTNQQIYTEFIRKHTDKISFSTIFTYGRTGSGKTYTMFGSENTPGIAELILEDRLNSHGVLSVRCIEIYNEVATDLFTGTPIRIVQESNTMQVISKTQVTVKTREDITSLLKTIMKKRKTSETEHNQASSRSHTVIEVNSINLAINLVDLAGNEKMAEDLDRRKEGLMINKSLLTLGKVIDQLHTDTHHVSYRESKLTRLLQNTLSYGTIICICTVMDLSDHLTIKFAERLKRIKTSERPVIKSKDEIINDLNQKIAYLTEQLQSIKTKSQLVDCVAAVNSPAVVHTGTVVEECTNPTEPQSEPSALTPTTAEEVIEGVVKPENGAQSANLYEMIYKYLKVGAEKEMTNTLTPQEMDAVHVQVTKQKKGLLDGTPFRSIFKMSRIEMRSSRSRSKSSKKSSGFSGNIHSPN
ncbi:centromeric protein E [Nematocida sp. ERTm5]|nr:centromeric protein E [Nematocida sp. ERTm5]